MPVRLAVLLVAFAFAAGAFAAPVKIVFDTDMDSDCDDVGALAMLHAMADREEADILATMVSAPNPWSAPCVDAVNTYFGRPDLPIGRYIGAIAVTPSRYAQKIAERFPHDTGRGERLQPAAPLYRTLLLAQPDASVVIVTVGDLSNIAALLQLPAEDALPAGVDVVRRKVREWVCMGGNFIGKPARDDLKLGNNNFTIDKASSHYAIQHWPTGVPLTFAGREIGSVPSGLKAGARLRELPETNIVRAAYEYYFGGEPKDRHVADQTAVLYAVRGLRDYWDIEARGRMDLAPDNTFTWRYDEDRHRYLLKRTGNGEPNDRAIERVIEDLMMQSPAQRETPRR